MKLVIVTKKGVKYEFDLYQFSFSFGSGDKLMKVWDRETGAKQFFHHDDIRYFVGEEK